MVVDAALPDTFPKLLTEHAQRRAERPAFREKSRGIWSTLTWRDFADEVEALAASLAARGVKRGAHVALLGDNRPRLYTAIAAAQWLGAIAVPLYQDASAEEIAAPLQNSQATHVFAENQEQVDKLLAILPHCPSIGCIVYDKDWGMRHYTQPELVTYADLVREGRELVPSKRGFLTAEAALGSGADAAFLFYTSGTIAAAKGVVLTYEALIDRARVLAETEGLKDTDTTMAYLPPGWVGQSLFGYILPMVVGYCVCCPESSETLVADMREIGPTCFLATPRVLQALLSDMTVRMEETGGLNQRLYRRAIAVAQRVGARALRGEAPSTSDRISLQVYNLLIYSPLRDVLGMSKVRLAYTAGEAVAPELLMFFRALGINLKQLYGSTETGFFVALQSDGEVKGDTVGRPGRGVEVKITPQSEILVRSPGMFKEYHRDPELTARARDAEGWFRTGDAGLLGEDGHLRIHDRIADAGVLSDGTPFAPKLIENKLKFFPYVKEAVAFGDRRDMICALVDIDLAPVGIWADKRNIPYTGYADLASRAAVYGLIADCIGKVNADLALVPAHARFQIHRFILLPKELHADEGVLTRTGKLKRTAIAERYRPLIDAMYEGRTAVGFETDDGTPAELNIGEVKAIIAEQDRRAA